MTHHRFRDDAGVWWEAWDVWPTSVERRARERRTRAALSQFRQLPLGSAERRAGERRQHLQVRAPMPSAFSAGWVVFQSHAERRRLAPVPPEWDHAGEAELRALCLRAASTGKPRRLIE